MNRQIVPSMILSVLIVCFFGILLFERDPPQAGASPERVATRKKTDATNSPSARPKPEDTAPSQPTDPSVRLKPERPQGTAELAKSQGQAISRDGRSAAPSQAASKAISTAKEAVSPKSHAREASKTPPAAPHQDVRRAVERGDRQKTSAVNQSQAPSAQPVPRSAFTVVQKGETLYDVTVRVYGSADPLDSLWHANRDVLPRRDSPLSPGSVLRTPEE
jgi:nucleoid-associated protein YgaU